jgi:hypothetical protein
MPSGRGAEEMLPHTLMEMMVMMVIMVMRKSVAADCPLLMNILLNTSQWGHRSPHGGSQLQFQPQKLQTTEHVTSIPVTRYSHVTVLFYFLVSKDGKENLLAYILFCI